MLNGFCSARSYTRANGRPFDIPAGRSRHLPDAQSMTPPSAMVTFPIQCVRPVFSHDKIVVATLLSCSGPSRSRPRGCPRSPRSRSTTDSTKAQCVVGFVLRDFRPTTQLFQKARTQPSQIWSRSSRIGSGQSSRALKVDPLRASSRRQGKQLGPRFV
jgi:hypothetical protein